MHTYIPENLLHNSKAISCPNYEGFLKSANSVLTGMKNEILKSKSRQLNCLVCFEFSKRRYFSILKDEIFSGIFKEGRERSLGQTPFTMITKTASPKIKRF